MPAQKKDNSAKWIAGFLVLLVCVMALMFNSPASQTVPNVPNAKWSDRTPMGAAGLRLLLDRLNYRVQRVDEPLTKMPDDARVWMILDPLTTFTSAEAKLLTKWVEDGGTLVWAASPPQFTLASPLTLMRNTPAERPSGLARLYDTFELDSDNAIEALLQSQRGDEPLPELSELETGAPSRYWSGVQTVQSLDSSITVKTSFLEIAGNELGTQVARIPFGKGAVFVTPDPMLFTNYALGKPDNAVFVTNLIRLSHPERGAAIYFDERRSEDEAVENDSLFSLIWKSPARYAIVQFGLAALFIWVLYGRRLGAPVPLRDSGPVTRASQFALAMGGLFQKAGRPEAAIQILAEDFRRAVVRRLGLSPADPDSEIAHRAGEAADMPPEMIERLLRQVHAPARHEADALAAAQEMEYVLRRLRLH